MLLETIQALLPLLCVAVVIGGIVLDLRLQAGAANPSPPPSDAQVDERFAMRLMADTLIRSLDLRPDCRDALVAELARERELVGAWLTRDASAARSA